MHVNVLFNTVLVFVVVLSPGVALLIHMDESWILLLHVIRSINYVWGAHGCIKVYILLQNFLLHNDPCVLFYTTKILIFQIFKNGFKNWPMGELVQCMNIIMSPTCSQNRLTQCGIHKYLTHLNQKSRVGLTVTEVFELHNKCLAL